MVLTNYVSKGVWAVFAVEGYVGCHMLELYHNDTFWFYVGAYYLYHPHSNS